MKTVFHPSNSRGYAHHGWLEARHSFSFAGWFHPERIQFGALRVLNDDIIQGGMGFGTHPHDNMEIITIPIEGALEHKDSMGHTATISAGDIQVMSAGTGIHHSEFNKNSDQPINLLQLWIFPNQRQVEPRYQQLEIASLHQKNKCYQLLSPKADDAGVWIYQDAWIYMLDAAPKIDANYQMHKTNQGAYVFVISGTVKIGNQILEKRDALGVWDTQGFEIQTLSEAKVLIVEIPMEP